MQITSYGGFGSYGNFEGRLFEWQSTQQSTAWWPSSESGIPTRTTSRREGISWNIGDLAGNTDNEKEESRRLMPKSRNRESNRWRNSRGNEDNEDDGNNGNDRNGNRNNRGNNNNNRNNQNQREEEERAEMIELIREFYQQEGPKKRNITQYPRYSRYENKNPIE